MGAVISVYLDTRRKKANGLYPIKIRVFYQTREKETRFYGTGIDATEEDFQKSYETAKPRNEYRDLKIKIANKEQRANKIAEGITPFDFESFEKQFLRSTKTIGSVFYYYDETIKKLNREERIGTASNYDLSQKSIKSFLKEKKKSEEYLGFDAVTVDFLNSYEKWMIDRGKSITTVSIYLRSLRALFNAALEVGEITKEIYPFKKGKYQIPAGENVKKSLGKHDLKKLFEYHTEDPNIIKARAFWFFSYLCNGINVRDICELKYKNVQKDIITFVRTKTKRTTKAKQATITAAIVPLVEEVIKLYGNKKTSPEQYVFPIYTLPMTAVEKRRQTQLFTRFINQHIKRLAKLCDVDEAISTYFARHTFSTISVRNGASVEFLQKSLGHHNIKTTMGYIGSLDNEAIKNNANQLMNFQ